MLLSICCIQCFLMMNFIVLHAMLVRLIDILLLDTLRYPFLCIGVILACFHPPAISGILGAGEHQGRCIVPLIHMGADYQDQVLCFGSYSSVSVS